MTKTKALIYLKSLTCILIIGCKNYTNKRVYNLKIGETVDLYISENSCCVNCFLNRTDLKSIILLTDTIAVKPAPSNCDGCTSIYAWTFKALRTGIDTIKIAETGGGQKCDEIDFKTTQVDIFIVNVK